jgi:hypothetical protein
VPAGPSPITDAGGNAMTGEVRPQDQASGLVERKWERVSRRAGLLAERTLEGERVTARFIGPRGDVRDVAGKVIRDAAGHLAIESWADGIRRETAVPRDASVDVTGRAR